MTELSPLLEFFANGHEKRATRISDLQTLICGSGADIPDNMHPAAAAHHINHTHGAGARQLQLGRERSSLNYAFASLLRSGESAQVRARRPAVMTWCDLAPWQPSYDLNETRCQPIKKKEKKAWPHKHQILHGTFLINLVVIIRLLLFSDTVQHHRD